MKKLIIGLLTLGSVSSFSRCHETIDCLLITSFGNVDSRSGETYKACKENALYFINYKGEKRVKMKFWDERNGQCIVEVFKK